MRITELSGHPVLDIDTAKEIATTKAVIIDAEAGRVSAFHVDGDAPVLSFDEVESVGADRITVRGAQLHEPRSPAEQRAVQEGLDPLGSKVLTEQGVEWGTVDDVEIDPADGRIVSLHVGGHDVPGGRLRGVGTYALVVGVDAPSEGGSGRSRSEAPADERTRDELYEEARRRDISGRSKMSKAELAEALRS